MHTEQSEEGQALRLRLVRAIGARPFAHVGQACGVSGETVRRYCAGAMPSAQFLMRFCLAYEINANWLLLGIGDPSMGSLVASSARQVGSEVLIDELARRLKQTLDLTQSVAPSGGIGRARPIPEREATDGVE